MNEQRSIWTRRDLLKGASAAMLSALLADPRRALAAPSPGAAGRYLPDFPPRADAVIVLWMAGGMAATETFDPKPFKPFEPGMRAEGVASTFDSVPTAVDGVRFSRGLESIGRVMDRGTVIRTFRAGDLGFILHSRHQYHWHTGYEPPQTVAAPHLGAWLSHALGPRDPALPAFIDIGQPYEGNGEAEELKAFQTGGILGTEHGPFRVPDPSQAIATVRPPAGMSMKRFRARQQARRKLVLESPLYRDLSGYQRESLLRSLDKAAALLESPAAKAFDLSLEPRDPYDAYDTGRFGLGCLLARRLVEHGARFIEVTTEYVPFLGWDTHDNGHTRLIDMKRMIDGPVSRLVLDLEARGLLDRTLIVLATEFSRSMLIEGKAEKPVKDQVEQPAVIREDKFFGMHRHFTGAGSILLFGGGAPAGRVYGVTSDEPPCTTIADPLTVTDLHATIYRLAGIGADYHVTVEDRPFYVTPDGKGRAARGLIG